MAEEAVAKVAMQTPRGQDTLGTSHTGDAKWVLIVCQRLASLYSTDMASLYSTDMAHVSCDEGFEM